MPKANRNLAYALGVGKQFFTVECWRRTRHHKAVAHTACHECATPETAHFNGVVYQFIVVQRLISPKPGSRYFDGFQSSSQLPAAQSFVARHLHHMGHQLATGYTQEQARTVKKTTPRVQPGAAHRVVKGIDLVGHDQRFVRACCDIPSAFVGLHRLARLCALPGAKVLKVFGKLPHQVAAGYPHRKAQALQYRRLVYSERDLKQVGVQVGHLNPVMDDGRFS